MKDPNWWQRPRVVTIVVDNPSWILPYARRLVAGVNEMGDDCGFVTDHEAVPEGDVAFYLGCLRITPPTVLARNRRNLVVHASDLPKGRGFSPMTWLILEGQNRIPVCLFEAVEELDAGPIIYREELHFQGHELKEEMQAALGALHVRLCLRFLSEPQPPAGTPQSGEPSFYPRRQPADSRLCPNKTIAEQFELLRTVDNEHYPAFFEHRGKRYKITIGKIEDTED